MMLNCDPRDRFEDKYLTIKILLFLAHLSVPAFEFNQIYIEIFCIQVGYILILTSSL